MNVRELKAQMILKGVDAEMLCKAMQISRTAWSRKTNGHSLFTQGEICAIRDALELTDQQVLRIFFDREVS